MKELTKKSNKLIEKGLKELGAKFDTDNSTKYGRSIYSLNTKCGKLTITLDRPESRDKIISCYSHFEDVNLAKKYVNCNPFSGKWNWTFFSNEISAEEFSNRVISDIKIITPVLTNLSGSKEVSV